MQYLVPAKACSYPAWPVSGWLTLADTYLGRLHSDHLKWFGFNMYWDTLMQWFKGKLQEIGDSWQFDKKWKALCYMLKWGASRQGAVSGLKHAPP